MAALVAALVALPLVVAVALAVAARSPATRAPRVHRGAVQLRVAVARGKLAQPEPPAANLAYSRCP